MYKYLRKNKVYSEDGFEQGFPASLVDILTTAPHRELTAVSWILSLGKY